MDRIAVPLSKMGAMVLGREKGRYPPMVIRGGTLKPIHYEIPVASAQVKSAILVAAAAKGISAEVKEPLPTRDHTERMLNAMGANVSYDRGLIKFSPADELMPLDVDVPSDFSSAAFFIVGSVITPSSEIVVRNVLVNPLRSGLLRVLERMGANIRLTNERVVSGEETADIIVKASELKGTLVDGREVPLLIDEVPILAVAAAFASGITKIRGAGELRVKESDRIASVTSQLSKLGVTIEELPDGMIIEGRGEVIKGGKVSSFGDHRIAMALEVFAVGAGIEISLDDRDCIATSFPEFYEKLGGLLT
jgi:3-phosphoshikimate 1-carboxyvinyltransferase